MVSSFYVLRHICLLVVKIILFSFRSLIVLAFISKSVIHLKLIFAYGRVTDLNLYIFFHIDT